MGIDDTALSRTVSHALRHDPAAYGIELDAQGWVEVAELVAALRRVTTEWADLTERDVVEMVERSAKRRHEIDGGRIRATYGHSTPDRIDHPVAEPPTTLYHGTTRSALPAILAEGLRPMPRQYVHLSGDVVTARRVGGRRDREPPVVEVLAGAASRSGVRFYRTGDGVWLADHVPAEFLRELADDQPGAAPARRGSGAARQTSPTAIRSP
jgi:putative RNA 2'-phosphotransferase